MRLRPLFLLFLLAPPAAHALEKRIRPQTLRELRQEQLEWSGSCPQHMRSSMASLLAMEKADATLARPHYFSRLQELVGVDTVDQGLSSPRRWITRNNTYGHPKGAPPVVVGSSDFFGIHGLYSFNSPTAADRQLLTAMTAISQDFAAALKPEQAGWGIQISQPGRAPRVHLILDQARMGEEFDQIALTAYKNLFKDYLDTLFAPEGIYWRRLKIPDGLRQRLRTISETVRGRTIQFSRVKEPFIDHAGPSHTRVFNSNGVEEVWPDELWYRLHKSMVERRKNPPPELAGLALPEVKLEFLPQVEHFTQEGGALMVVSRGAHEPLPTELLHPGHPLARGEGATVELGRFSVAKGAAADTSPALIEQMAASAFGLPDVKRVIIEADAVHERLYGTLGFARIEELEFNGASIARLELTPERFYRAVLEKNFPEEAAELARSAPVNGLPRLEDRLKRHAVLAGEVPSYVPTAEERAQVLRVNSRPLSEKEHLGRLRHSLPKNGPPVTAEIRRYPYRDGKLLPWIARARAHFGSETDFNRFLAIARAAAFEDAVALDRFLEANGPHQGVRIILEEVDPGKNPFYAQSMLSLHPDAPLRERILSRGDYRVDPASGIRVRDLKRYNGTQRILPVYRGTAVTGPELRRLLSGNWIRYAEDFDARLAGAFGNELFTGGQPFTIDEAVAQSHAVEKFNAGRGPMGDEPLYPVVVQGHVSEGGLLSPGSPEAPPAIPGDYDYRFPWGIGPHDIDAFTLLLPDGRSVQLGSRFFYRYEPSLQSVLASLREQGMTETEIRQLLGLDLGKYPK